LDTVQKIWASLKKLIVPPGVPSWLRAGNLVIFADKSSDFEIFYVLR